MLIPHGCTRISRPNIHFLFILFILNTCTGRVFINSDFLPYAIISWYLLWLCENSGRTKLSSQVTIQVAQAVLCSVSEIYHGTGICFILIGKFGRNRVFCICTLWVKKKHATILLSVTSPNVDRFSKFLVACFFLTHSVVA